MAVIPLLRYKPLINPYLKTVGKELQVGRKRFFKDPLLCLGIFSVIFMAGIAVFAPKLIFNPQSLWDFSFLTANSSLAAGNSLLDLFIEPDKNLVKDSPDMAFLQQNSVLGIVPPSAVSQQVLGILVDTDQEDVNNEKAITEYVVEQGDTISSVAEKFGISVNTILWANDLSKNSKLKAGQKLVILPVSGIVYHVKKGDTLGAIAKTYKGKTEEIVVFNELSGEGDIFIGDILIIPNGAMPAAPKAVAAQPQIPVASSYFICPNSTCKINQRLHWYNAVDFGGKCGDPVYASAGGTVQRVAFGWNGGAGNYISILHPNGVVTSYGHISAALVSSGQEVSQGQIIALVGGKPGTAGAGISTGCHIHFSTKGAANPFR